MDLAARIQDGLVVELVELPFRVQVSEEGQPVIQPDRVSLEEAFHPEAGFVAAPADIEIGMTYADGEFGPVPEPEPPNPGLIKAMLNAYAADRRWQREVGGITVAGVPVATDDRSKTMIIGARVAAMADPEWSTIWHGADGHVYPVDAAAMVAISDAVQAHVNQSFASFAAVKAAIEAGEITTRVQIDAALG